MTTPESPIIQIERRKAIALFAAVVILAVALFGGLLQVGGGISSRTDNGIVVTGSARTEAIADNAVWTLSVSLSRPKVSDAVAKVATYCLQHGVITMRAGLYTNCIRLLMPLVITDEQLQEGLDVLEAAMKSL